MIALLLAATFMLLPQPVGEAGASDRLIVNWSYQPELMPDSVVLKLRNRGSNAICIPRVEVEGPSLLLFQGGKEVDPVHYTNRPILVWRGADVISGLLVIPPGRSVKLFYDLHDWYLASGPTEARLELPRIDCLAFFHSAKPSIVRKLATYQFTASPTQDVR
ncbi:hypothetical protein FHR20_000366 [Sphingomonas leidyi]|uniref:Uncharacterized protein n=1 Tax=Sphingomonas leidyi TaxID=68569 RepID=A0A7X5ZTX4_9SPHN|nr:hypothetical protein [Sphingomonas leidyi]NIJ63435.1 hypothetical protein [Sphingomonas leidyi]